MRTLLREKHSELTKVMVVDDCRDSSTFIAQILSHLACDVSSASGGEEAIPLFLGERFDLIFLDWEMPVMGGRETLIAFDEIVERHKIKKFAPSIPVVVYTGITKDIDLPRCNHFFYYGLIDKQQTFSSILRSINVILNSIR